MMCVSMSDAGMIVLPTHRLFRGVPHMSSETLQSKISDCFRLREWPVKGSIWPSRLGNKLRDRQQQSTLALYTAADQRWLMASLNANGQSRMDAISPGP